VLDYYNSLLVSAVMNVRINGVRKMAKKKYTFQILFQNSMKKPTYKSNYTILQHSVK